MSEVIIYNYLAGKKSGTFSVFPECTGKKSAFFLNLSRTTAATGIVLLILFCVVPSVWAWGQAAIEVYNGNFAISGAEVQNIENAGNIQGRAYLPPLDPSLPASNRVIIPKIGVNTDIQEAAVDNYESALKKGVWRVSDFGSPTDTGEPIILAAHRFGYLAWTGLYRHLNSFYDLPKVSVGDTVEIDWRERKYTYEVYAVGKGTEIKDYSADLILYTCESLVSPERIFVYAHLVQPR